ncbi:MAG: hypothetical protein WBA67_17040 [Jannaschia sp.]
MPFRGCVRRGQRNVGKKALEFSDRGDPCWGAVLEFGVLGHEKRVGRSGDDSLADIDILKVVVEQIAVVPQSRASDQGAIDLEVTDRGYGQQSAARTTDFLKRNQKGIFAP